MKEIALTCTLIAPLLAVELALAEDDVLLAVLVPDAAVPLS